MSSPALTYEYTGTVVFSSWEYIKGMIGENTIGFYKLIDPNPIWGATGGSYWGGECDNVPGTDHALYAYYPITP